MRLIQPYRLAVFLALVAVSCGCAGSKLDSYVAQLECGMTLKQTRSIFAKQIKGVGEHRLGNFRADFGRSAIWLTFSDGELKSATTQIHTGLLSARISPKKNLCTGELTYFVSVEWLAELQAPNVYLDGRLVAEEAKSGLVLEMSEGEHVIRLEKSGIVPVQRRIKLDEDSFGDQWVDIENFERLMGQ